MPDITECTGRRPQIRFRLVMIHKSKASVLVRLGLFFLQDSLTLACRGKASYSR